MLRFKDTSTPVGHFVRSTGERKKKGIEKIVAERKVRDERKRKMNESVEQITTFPLYPNRPCLAQM